MQHQKYAIPGIVKKQQSILPTTIIRIAPKTRSAGPITPQKPKSSHTIYTTRHRIRFFDAWDTCAPGISLRQFCQDRDPDFGTASR